MKETQPKTNIIFKILPFGQATIEVKSSEQIKEEKIEQTPTYTNQKTTDVKTIEITFGGNNYIVPKTTGGLL